MSFKDLAAAHVARRKQTVTIKLEDGREVTFHANEISYLQRIELGISRATDGGNMHLGLVALSITDEEGKHMTLEQAQGLSDEHQEVFYRAALDVNFLEEKAKKKAK